MNVYGIVLSVLEDVPASRVIQITFTIPAPCDVCSKTIYVNTEVESAKAIIPDYSFLTVVMVLGLVVFLVSRKK